MNQRSGAPVTFLAAHSTLPIIYVLDDLTAAVAGRDKVAGISIDERGKNVHVGIHGCDGIVTLTTKADDGPALEEQVGDASAGAPASVLSSAKDKGR